MEHGDDDAQDGCDGEVERGGACAGAGGGGFEDLQFDCRGSLARLARRVIASRCAEWYGL